MKKSVRVRTGAVVTGLTAAALMGVTDASAQVTPQNPDGPVREVLGTLTTPEGVTATVGYSRGWAKLQPSRAVTPFSNRFTVTGSGWARIAALGAGSVDRAEVETGYIVACQVGVDGASVGAGAQLGAIALGAFGGLIPAGAAGPFAVVGGDVSVQLSPGTAKRIPFGVKRIDKPKVGETFGVRYQGVQIDVDKCGGNIDAVAYTQLTTADRKFDASKAIYGQVVRVR